MVRSEQVGRLFQSVSGDFPKELTVCRKRKQQKKRGKNKDCFQSGNQSLIFPFRCTKFKTNLIHTVLILVVKVSENIIFSIFPVQVFSIFPANYQ